MVCTISAAGGILWRVFLASQIQKKKPTSQTPKESMTSAYLLTRHPAKAELRFIESSESDKLKPSPTDLVDYVVHSSKGNEVFVLVLKLVQCGTRFFRRIAEPCLIIGSGASLVRRSFFFWFTVGVCNEDAGRNRSCGLPRNLTF